MVQNIVLLFWKPLAYVNQIEILETLICLIFYAFFWVIPRRGITQKKAYNIQYTANVWNQDCLTLRLLMSYIYGAPSKARNANVVYIYMDLRLAMLKQSLSICCTTFQHWINAERFPVSHVCVNTLPASWQSVYTQMWHRKPLCIDSVLKHCAANRKRLFQRCQT